MKSFFIKTLSLFAILIFSNAIIAQVPSGYYNSADGLTGTQLKVALHNIIDDHDGNNDAYDYFYLTDTRPDNGKVWDIYSDNPDGAEAYYFTFGSDKCGNYNSEGDCYNREHSWPQSWVNDQSTPTKDIHAIFPTDGWVNGKRAALPYGEVSNPNYTSSNGCKKGLNTIQGYSGEVFEPIDEYKGDIARAYFYFTTRYYGEDSGWESNDMVTKSVIKEWALRMLLDWHENDPVSDKEIDRNNAIYQIQENRNPFIDNPIYVDAIWDPNFQDISTSFVNKLNIYPNPTEDIINIDFNNTELIETVKVYNTIGTCVLELKQLDANKSISCSNLHQGLYIIEITDNIGVYTSRFIKK